MAAITIKPITRSDAAELIQANIDSRDYHAPWIQPFTNMNGLDIWFSQLITSQNISLVAREMLPGSVVGVLNINQIVWCLFQSAYLRYYGMVAHSRRGLMTKALRLTASYAFGEVGLHRLEANIQPTNMASIALVRRVGFQKEGFSPRYLKISGV